MISFLARHSEVDVHYHQCFQIVVSLRNTFNSVIDGKAYQGLNGFFVNQYVTHSCQATFYTDRCPACGDRYGHGPFCG